VGVHIGASGEYDGSVRAEAAMPKQLIISELCLKLDLWRELTSVIEFIGCCEERDIVIS